MRQLDPTTARLMKWVFEGLILRLERVADSIAAVEQWTVTDRNVRLALVIDRLEPTITKAASSIYRAAAVADFKRQPGPFDHDALNVLYPEASEAESARLERVEIARERNLVENKDASSKVTPGDWLRLLAALQENLVDLEFRLNDEAKLRGADSR